MKNGRCPKCGSKAVLAGVEVQDDGRSNHHALRVVVVEPEPRQHPAVWVQGQAEGELHAWICGRCGYTELYADNLKGLVASYRKIH